MADKARIATDKELAKMERHLSAIYNRASKEVGETWKKYLAEVGEEIKPLQDAYDVAKMAGDQEAIKKTGRALAAKQREKTLMDKHYRQLTEQLGQEITAVKERAAAYVNGRLPGVYATNYNFTAAQIEIGVDGAISFELVNERTIKNLVEAGDKSLLPLLEVDPAKDVKWNMRNINAEVLQGILQGESVDKIAGRLLKVEKMSEGSAIRAARTVVNSTENKARYDNASAAEAKGVIVKKEWIAVGDSRTRHAHARAWAEYGTRETAIPIDEPFVVDGEEIMFAGDMSASAANVYNCRCSTPYFPVGFTSTLPPEKRGKIVVRFTE